MLINFTMAAGHLSDLTILSSKMDRLSERLLQFPVHYTGETSFKSDRLYIAKSEDLTGNPIFEGLTAIISIGYPPMAYHHDSAELLCIGQNTAPEILLNILQGIFGMYQAYESEIFDIFQTENFYEKMGELALKLFNNPVSAYDAHEKLLFFQYDPTQKVLDNAYENVQKPGEFMPEEERRILQLDPQFLATYATIGPSLDEKRIYHTNALYTNLREDMIYLGRFLVEDAYKTFEDFEYPLLEWFGSYLKKSLLNKGNPRFGDSNEVEEMMRQLLLLRMPYAPEYDRLLKTLGWEKDDDYICVCISSIHGSHPKTPQLDAAIYLNELFDSHYILLNDPRIIQIFNLTRSQYSMEQYLRRLEIFLNDDNCIAGMGGTIQHFPDVRICLQQAVYALDYHRKSGNQRLLKFADCVLDILIDNAKGNYGGEFYCTDAVKKLMEYDRINNTELFKTLRCYIENNMNATKTQEVLHIARTTSLYRINRIEEITHLSLHDPDIRLYLLLLFRLIDHDYNLAD